MRMLLFVLWAIFGPVSSTIAQGSDVARPTVTIGARVDSRPFIWRDAVTREYLGFFWDICTDAVTRAGYWFEARELSAGARGTFLETGEGDFDLLCDPTTITLQRMQNFIGLDVTRRLRFSPIIFVANGAYVKSLWHPSTAIGFGQFGQAIPGCNAAIAAEVKPSEPVVVAERGILRSLADWIPIQMVPDVQPVATEDRYEIWGYVDGMTSKGMIDRALGRKQGDVTICPRPLATHAEAARAFCTGRIARYYGDVEIVRAAIEDFAAIEGTDCIAKFDPNAQGSYESYAFVVSGRTHRKLPEEFDHALYGMFSDGSVERLFVGHFPGKAKSRFLSTLFRINSLPGGMPP